MLALNVLLLMDLFIAYTTTAVNDPGISPIIVEPNGTCCLVCPVMLGSTANQAIWKQDNTAIIRDGARLKKPNIFVDMTVDTCHNSNQSLELFTITMSLSEQAHFTCWDKSGLKATFLLEVRARPSVAIVKNDRIITTDLAIISCRVQEAIPPFNITWFVDGEKRNHDTEPNLTFFTSSLTVHMTEDYVTVTCLVNGDHIVTQTLNTSLSVASEVPTIVPHGGGGGGGAQSGIGELLNLIPLYALIPILFLVSILTSIIVYVRIKGGSEDTLHIHHPVAYTTTLNRSVEGEVQYESPQEMIGDIYFYGDNYVLNGNDFELVSFIPGSGRRERWIASPKWKGQSSSVVATTLCAEMAKTEDWLDMRLLAEHLRHIPKHENVVAISGCDTDQIPYYIYSEHVTNGTLLDILSKAKYDELYSKTIYMKGMRGTTESTDVYRIGSFLLEPLKAIFFLESIDCDHIALCARKVLVTPNMTCKLYDFNLQSSTKKFVATANLEEYLRLPWLAPETIFDRKYDRGSDVWSFAVFIWEVFSEGDVPFDGVDIKKFSSNPKDIPLLAQPRLCSDAVYAIMKSCLMVNPGERIGLTALKTKLFNMVKGVDQ